MQSTSMHFLSAPLTKSKSQVHGNESFVQKMFLVKADPYSYITIYIGKQYYSKSIVILSTEKYLFSWKVRNNFLTVWHSFIINHQFQNIIWFLKKFKEKF